MRHLELNVTAYTIHHGRVWVVSFVPCRHPQDVLGLLKDLLEPAQALSSDPLEDGVVQLGQGQDRAHEG